MRRNLSTVVGTAAVFVLPLTLMPQASSAAMHSATQSPALPWVLARSASSHAASLRAAGPAEPEEEEDIIRIDEGDDEEPVEGEAGEPVEASVDGGLFGGDEDVDTGAPVEGSDSESLGTEEDQIKAEMGLISVVQHQPFLKKGRFELMPQFGITVNDPYVRHYTIGLDLNYWLSNRMALGLTGTGLIGARTPRYNNIRFQEGLLLTANRNIWQASANFTYNPFYGKIAIFNRALMHWEGSLVVGGGALQTQIIPRFEAIHEPFSTITGGGHFGFLGRFYAQNLEWVSFNFGVRSWVYADKSEPINRGPDDSPDGTGDNPMLDDAQAAKDEANFELAWNVTFFLGASFYLPTSFEYSTPR